MLEIRGDNIKIHEETDGGWPTIVTLETENHPVGIAVDYLGTWHGQDVGIEEVDLLLSYEDGEWGWRAIVAFTTKDDAINRGRYKTSGYNGYELVAWSDDNRYERMDKLLDQDITPIAYTEEHPTYPAHAMQEAGNIHVLNRMFGLGKLKTMEERREKLFKKVVPRDVRWDDEDTSLQDLARNVVENDEDNS
jgi:hypothetical protein